VVEAGCGVGNSVFPLLAANSSLHIYAFDFSPRAISLLKENPLYGANKSRCSAFVCDLTKENSLLLNTQSGCNARGELSLSEDGIPRESADCALLCFVLSAIAPQNHRIALKQIAECLKPGGLVLFRDYAVGDLAEKRFKAANQLDDDHFFVRQDGTRSYFFSETYLDALCSQVGLLRASSRLIKREVVNRKQNSVMHRVWLQAKFVKSEQ